MKTLEQCKKECGPVRGAQMYVEEICMVHLNSISYGPAGGESLYNPHDYSAVRRVKARRVVARLDAATVSSIAATGQLPEAVKNALEAAPHPGIYLGSAADAVPFILFEKARGQ